MPQKVSVLYLLKGYPQISQTYVKSELEAVWDDYDVTIINRKRPNSSYRQHYPHRLIQDAAEIEAAVQDVRPDVLHTHYLNQLGTLGAIAERCGIPFTIRAHSFDTVPLRGRSLVGFMRRVIEFNTPQFKKVARLKDGLHWLNHELCLGVLTFPFTRPWLEKAGVRSDKIIDCFPVVSVDRFYDTGPNGDAIMNTGAVIPKKRMDDFLRLAALVPDQRFNLYALGYDTDKLARRNDKRGQHVTIVPQVEPDEMPAEYKKHRWLVYTADFTLATVGWPMAVAEAQAAGVGVCMPNIRPDVRDYVGDAGILYDRIEDVVEQVRNPVPEEMRHAGFEQAQKSNIQRHKHLLTDLWDGVQVSRQAERPLARAAAG